MDKSFVGLYNEELIKSSPDREKKEIKSWHASGLGSCPTGRYLERMGVPPDKEFDARTLDVFAVGKAEEEFFLSVLANSEKMKLEQQVRIESKELNATGYADFVAQFPDNGIAIVGEIKSKHSKAFWYMEKKKEGPPIHNKMQLWLYLYILKIPEGRLIYISKDDRCKLEYPVYLNDKTLEKLVLDELDMLNKAWEAKLPPPVLFDNKDWRATYCRWHKKCVCQKEYLKI